MGMLPPVQCSSSSNANVKERTFSDHNSCTLEEDGGGDLLSSLLKRFVGIDAGSPSNG